jgi:hypothetical protein
MFNKKLLLAFVAFAVSTQIQAAALPDPAFVSILLPSFFHFLTEYTMAG